MHYAETKTSVGAGGCERMQRPENTGGPQRSIQNNRRRLNEGGPSQNIQTATGRLMADELNPIVVNPHNTGRRMLPTGGVDGAIRVQANYGGSVPLNRQLRTTAGPVDVGGALDHANVGTGLRRATHAELSTNTARNDRELYMATDADGGPDGGFNDYIKLEELNPEELAEIYADPGAGSRVSFSFQDPNNDPFDELEADYTGVDDDDHQKPADNELETTHMVNVPMSVVESSDLGSDEDQLVAIGGNLAEPCMVVDISDDFGKHCHRRRGKKERRASGRTGRP